MPKEVTNLVRPGTLGAMAGPDAIRMEIAASGHSDRGLGLNVKPGEPTLSITVPAKGEGSVQAAQPRETSPFTRGRTVTILASGNTGVIVKTGVATEDGVKVHEVVMKKTGIKKRFKETKLTT
jgi:hypothetical protein